MTFTTFMRPHSICLAMLLIFSALPACVLAGFSGPGTLPVVTTAAEALNAADDSPCILEGRLEARIPSRKNRYLFADATGKIVVEIKKKVFKGLTVTPANRIRLEGEVDWNSKHENEVEVDDLHILE